MKVELNGGRAARGLSFTVYGVRCSVKQGFSTTKIELHEGSVAIGFSYMTI